MPSGSRKEDFTSQEQYERQLEHSRAWKARNKERVREYNREYNRRKRAERRAVPMGHVRAA